MDALEVGIFRDVHWISAVALTTEAQRAQRRFFVCREIPTNKNVLLYDNPISKPILGASLPGLFSSIGNSR